MLGEADATYPLQKKGHTLEFLREIAHLRPRSNLFGAVFRVRSRLAFAVHQFFQEKSFFYVHTPIITASDCEGAGEMFRVTTLDPRNPPMTEEGEVDYTKDFFGKKAFLTVSGQLEGEIFACALSNIYTFGPTFRAENSNTSRHAAEFWMIEPEMAFCDLAGRHGPRRGVREIPHPRCAGTLRGRSGVLRQVRRQGSARAARLRARAAVPALQLHRGHRDPEQERAKRGSIPVAWGDNLQSEHERFLAEEHFKCPVTVYNYPRAIKPFYMRVNDDGKTVAAMDVLVPGIGEIIGGSQREERLDVLQRRHGASTISSEKDYWWYLDLRRYGTVPHAGFGLGFERMLMFVTGVANIRDVIPFARTPGTAEF